MSNDNRIRTSLEPSPAEDGSFEVELHKVPIHWDLENGNLTFFGLDSALFWTDPSLIHMLTPLAEEVGNDLFRLLVAYSSSLGTEEDYHAMVSTLADNFEDGFLAWGRAVSTAGWGTFELPEYDPDNHKATVIVRNSWEIGMQRNLPAEKRWGAPFVLGKVIGIFNHAFGISCWAEDSCYYDSDSPRTELRIFPSKRTIQYELRKLRYEHMLENERALAAKVDQKTAELKRANEEIEKHSKTLEQQVAERTEELVEVNNELQAEIAVRKEAEAKRESLIVDLQRSLEEVKTLSGLLPICSSCKKIRDDTGYWNQIESYLHEHSGVDFSHGICPDCARKLYPEYVDPTD